MAGFDNDVCYFDNVDTRGVTPITGQVTADGELLIGNASSPNIRVGNITSPLGTLTVGYSSPDITIDLTGGSSAIDSIAVQTGISPAVPTAAGLLTFNGAVVTAGTNPVRTDGTAPNTMALEVQISQAIAATDATKIGLCNFDSADFTVDANGFVSASGTIGQTITGDSGGALSPSSGNWNILGGPGVTTSGSGSTLTINSVVFTDQGSSTSVTSDSGSFATAAITLTLPASPAQGELVEFVCTTANALVIDAPSTHLIRIGSLISSAGGTVTSTAIGDSIRLRYRSADTTWYAVGAPQGVWTIA